MHESIPTKWVVYELRGEEGRLMYIGASIKHRARWSQHYKDNSRVARWLVRRHREGTPGRFCVFCYCGSYTEMNEVERSLIERLRPPLNLQYTGRISPKAARLRSARADASLTRLIDATRRLSQLRTESGPELERRVQRRRNDREGREGQKEE
jgi:hypothetical protein